MRFAVSMTFNPPSTLSVLAFTLVTAGVIAALFVGTYVSSVRLKIDSGRRIYVTALLVLSWLGLGALVVASGLLTAIPIPFLPAFFVVMIGSPLAFSMSSFGLDLAKAVPMQALVAFQGFRFILELVLHSWSEQGTIPSTMTWTGQNFDIIAGIMALLVAPFAAERPSFAWAFNVVGAGLLLNVMRTAILSSPLPFAWKVSPPLQLANHFPYFLIVPVCIGGALAGHVILTRSLFLRKGFSP